MIFSQHYLECMSQASYLLGDESTGRAVVVDPRRDVDAYVEEAEAHGLTIERVIETHVHADFLSGHLELAARTGAVISYGAGAIVEFPIEPLHDGQQLTLGQVMLQVLATPGHTPESICIVIYEHPDHDAPFGVLTGDTLFVGGVGRPDLLATADDRDTTEAMARQLYRSLHDKVLTLPDSTRVFPAHGAGSACGNLFAAENSSTVGAERRSNRAVRASNEDAFVADVANGQPCRPGYFGYDARRNRQLRPLADTGPLPTLDLDDVLRIAAEGAALLDTRPPDEFARCHLDGAINVGLGGRFAELAGSVIAPERELVLVGDVETAAEARLRLGRIGYDGVVGQLRDPAIARTRRPDLCAATRRITAGELDSLRIGSPVLQLIDVRTPAETEVGMVPEARPIPLVTLTSSLATIDPTVPVVVYCATGQRSLVAASVLAAVGFDDVRDLIGGFDAWSGRTGAARRSHR